MDSHFRNSIKSPGPTNQQITFKNSTDHAISLLENKDQKYIWNKFFTYSETATENDEIIQQLEENSKKLKPLWSINLGVLNKNEAGKKRWIKRLKKMKLTEQEALNMFYNGDAQGLTKGKKRSDVLALFMCGTTEILDFYNSIDKLKVKTANSTLTLAELLAEKTIEYFGEVQPWYNQFLIKTDQQNIELCSTDVFTTLCSKKGFYTPVNIITKPANDKSSYLTPNLEDLNIPAIKDRFSKTVGSPFFSEKFWEKLIVDVKCRLPSFAEN